MKKLAVLILLYAGAAFAQAFSTTPVRQRFDYHSALMVSSDSLYVNFADTTLTPSGKRIIVGSLHDPQFNCANATPQGDSYNCGGSFERFRELEKGQSIHNSRNATAVADSGGLHPAEFAVTITTGSDSIIIWDRLTSKIFAVVVKAANNACGNNNFNDVAFRDGKYYIGTAGGVCIGDYLQDKFLLYSTSGLSEYQGTWHQRNAASTSLVINTSPAIANNGVNSISVMNDPFGKRDGLGRLINWWRIGTTAYISVYNPYTNAIYDGTYTTPSTFQAGLLSSRGVMWDTRRLSGTGDLFYHRQIMSLTADGWGAGDPVWHSGQAGGQKIAWSASAVSSRLALIERASVSGAEGDVVVAGSDEGMYFWHIFEPSTTLSAKIRVTNSYIAAPEIGDAVGSWINGDNTTDASQYGNTLTAVGSPGFTAASSSVVFSGAYSSVVASYLHRWNDTDLRLTAGQSFTIHGCFKSASATNPVANTGLFWLQTTVAGPADKQVRVLLETNGSLFGNVSDGAASDDCDPSTDVVDGQWHHVVLTRNGTTAMYLYVDGVLSASDVSLASTVALATDSLTVGAIHGGGTAGTTRFIGKMAGWSYSKAYTPPAMAQWLADRMLKSLQIEASGRKLHAADVDYVQCYGKVCAAGDEDSTIVWDGVMGLPLPKMRYGSPGGNIQDAAVYAIGQDSTGLYQVSTTRTKFVAPDPRMMDLSQRQFAFVQPAIGERVVVDSTGVRGIFWAPGDAFAAAKNAGIPDIFIGKGTWLGGITLSQDSLKIWGSGRDTKFGVGAASANAFTISGAYNQVHNLAVYTTPGGVSSNNDALVASSGSVGTILNNVTVLMSDGSGIDVEGARSQVIGCAVYTCDNIGINPGDAGDNSILIGNLVKDCGGGPLTIGTNNEDVTAVGNRFDGASTDNSGTSTLSGNDETAF